MILRGDYSSDILKTKINVQFMIPENCKGPYKIVYLLHGLHGNQGSWTDNSMLPFYGKKYDAIFVMPEASRSFYFDLKIGRKYNTFISEELPNIIKKIFNVSGKREDCAIIGYSMGGFGSLLFALSKPELYGFCGTIAPACLYFKPVLEMIKKDTEAYLKTDYEPEEVLKDLYAIFNTDLTFRPEADVPELAKNFPANKLKPIIYAACGTEDNLINENRRFRDEMKTTTFDFTYEEWAGKHDWNFFNEALRKALEFWYKDKIINMDSASTGDA
ncbi:MAG: alpha/beta hydrolase-fold protein [Treponema sp.]|nr:alpha/beta hydrolase-fold protein [Treponema sp.]